MQFSGHIIYKLMSLAHYGKLVQTNGWALYMGSGHNKTSPHFGKLCYTFAILLLIIDFS